jgi:Fe-S-cluster containining protein
MSPARLAESPSDVNSSRLCLECGLCCQGIFHGTALIQAAEKPLVKRLGLRIVETEKGPAFPLPCHLHHENRCTVYEKRPSPCSNYRCKLLRHYLEGESTLPESLARIHEAKVLVTKLRDHLGTDSLEGIWQKLHSLGEDRVAATLTDRELLMDFISLLTLSRQNFQNRAQPKTMWPGS